MTEDITETTSSPPFKWSDERTLKLIELRNSPEYSTAFKEAASSPLFIQKVWKKLAAEIDSELSGKATKIKYNGLIVKYRKNVQNYNEVGYCNWKYWDAFRSSLSDENLYQFDDKTLSEVIDTSREEPTLDKSEIIEEEKVSVSKIEQSLDEVEPKNEKKRKKISKESKKKEKVETEQDEEYYALKCEYFRCKIAEMNKKKDQFKNLSKKIDKLAEEIEKISQKVKIARDLMDETFQE